MIQYVFVGSAKKIKEELNSFTVFNQIDKLIVIFGNLCSRSKMAFV